VQEARSTLSYLGQLSDIGERQVWSRSVDPVTDQVAEFSI